LFSRFNEAQNNQFKVDIRNAPIQEEDGDASAALANVAHALRAVSHSDGLWKFQY
jgi:quercetin dioxygenase-like cupin family protein